MESKHKSYTDLKRDYWKLLSRSKNVKGRVRALVGGIVWFKEKEYLESRLSPLDAHSVALSDALEVVSKNKTQMQLMEKLSEIDARWASRSEVIKRPRFSPILSRPIARISDWQHSGLNAISLFSGAMGLDLGFMSAGFDVRLANDIDRKSMETSKTNLPNLEFLNKDIDSIQPTELMREASLSKGELDVLVGGPPCQPFSPAGRREGLSDPRASPLKYFIKAIKALQPRAFVMEEVPGLLSSRLKHFPISDRWKRSPTSEEREGSAFAVVLSMLNSTGYKFTYGKLNAADFGSPQTRERILFIGLRDDTPSLPEPTHSCTPQTNLPPWNSLWDGIADLSGAPGVFAGMSAKTKDYMRFVPPGGNWRELPEGVLRTAMAGAFYSGGGKMGFFRRLGWDDPSPTVVTMPTQKGTMFVHPDVERPLSVREYARIQGFPDVWVIAGSTADKYRLIGNAVPVYLSYAVARHLRAILEGKPIKSKRGIYVYE